MNHCLKPLLKPFRTSLYRQKDIETDMAVFWIAFAIFSKIIYVQNRMIPLNYYTRQPITNEVVTPPDESMEDNQFESVIGLKDYNHRQQAGYELEKTPTTGNSDIEKKKACSIVVLSNIQNPSMQSILRKYRYDGNGVLIPSSVKYYIKLPQGFGSAPLLVPLKDKAFSPLGGFLRYYKEVPPIPQSW